MDKTRETNPIVQLVEPRTQYRLLKKQTTFWVNYNYTQGLSKFTKETWILKIRETHKLIILNHRVRL